MTTQTATTWQVWYRNELIQVRRRHTVQYSICHDERQFEVDPFRKTQPLKYNIEGIGHVVVAIDEVGTRNELQRLA